MRNIGARWRVLAGWLAERHWALSAPGVAMLTVHTLSDWALMLTPTSWHDVMPHVPESLGSAGFWLMLGGASIYALRYFDPRFRAERPRVW